MTRHARLAMAVVATAALAGCGVAAPAPDPPPSVTPPSGPLLSQDSDSETLCYAEDIRVSYDDAKPTGTHRCVKAGVSITVFLPNRPTLLFAQATSSDPRIATVAPGQATGGRQYVVATHEPGDVAITSAQQAAGAPQHEWVLTVSVS